MSDKNWKEALADQIPEERAQEIDVFEGQLELRRQNKLDEKVFAETRLRWGTYGQRYDNGQRYDGTKIQALSYPAGDLTKGPNTLFDAPGMQRIKIPFGGLTPDHMDVLAETADESLDGILHVTTRQDFQLHFVHIEDVPDLFRRLMSVGITTQEACGNTVRNVTACPLAGICHDETFDVTPYAKAMAYFLLGHDDTQDFGRKFKTAFSGCEQHACGLVNMQDCGVVARVKNVDGQMKRGFAVYVGGGLGTIPFQAKLLSDFVAEDEILPLAQSIARVFARLGEKKNRNRARIKFLVQDLGIDKFRELVFEERKTLTHDPRWTEYIADELKTEESALNAGGELPELVAIANASPEADAFNRWLRSNTRPQRQAGYVTATVAVPLADATANQSRPLAASTLR